MGIIDLNGQKIEVTDLIAAIKQTDLFKNYRHEPPDPKADKILQAYWKNVHDKLLQLQLNKNHNEQLGK